MNESEFSELNSLKENLKNMEVKNQLQNLTKNIKINVNNMVFQYDLNDPKELLNIKMLKISFNK